MNPIILFTDLSPLYLPLDEVLQATQDKAQDDMPQSFDLDCTIPKTWVDFIRHSVNSQLGGLYRVSCGRVKFSHKPNTNLTSKAEPSTTLEANLYKATFSGDDSLLLSLHQDTLADWELGYKFRVTKCQLDYIITY